MKTIFSIKKFFGVCLGALLFTSCQDFFDNDLVSVIDTQGHTVKTERDAFYHLCGILQLMQQVGNDYVISGELRGDLMTQTNNTPQDLRDIEFFAADSANAYLHEKKLYALINNCNYYIDRLDTEAMGAKTDTLSVPVRTIRAWAFLQLALDYGKVHYFTKPILNTNDEVDVEDIDFTATAFTESENELPANVLIEKLIEELRPYCPASDQEEIMPFIEGEYSTINSFQTKMLILPVRFMLGELYMWKQDFASAAEMYHSLMVERKLTISMGANRWRNSMCDDVSTRKWSDQFTNIPSDNFVSLIAYSDEFEHGMTRLPDLLSSYQLGASGACREIFDAQQFSISNKIVPVSGDLRGEGKTSDYGSYVMNVPANSTTGEYTDAYITKIGKMKANDAYYTSLCRAPLIYLRYAEAVNRLGKHQLAMAVLKYGLTTNVLNNRNYIKEDELGGEIYTDFGQMNSAYTSIFSKNAALHSRGSGDVDFNLAYRIDTSTGLDSLTDVENKIMDEYVLECAFEGNRFHDLMRISTYRNDPGYLATKVASKLATAVNSPRSREEWITFLSDKNNWYLPSTNR